MQTTTSTSGKTSIANTSTAILTADAGRMGLILSNDSDEVLYLAFGEAAVLNQGVRLEATAAGREGGVLTMDTLVSTQAINAISTSGTKNLSYTAFYK